MQLSTPTPETCGALAAALGLLTLAAKKLIPRPKPKPEYLPRAEFHSHLDSLRDRISAGHLALVQKLDDQHNQVLIRLDQFESRLDRLDTAVARIDERTKTL